MKALSLSVLSAALLCLPGSHAAGLSLAREGNWLVIKGPQIPGGDIKINYLEAYCRTGSSDADWSKHTVIRHNNDESMTTPDGKAVRLHDKVADGLEVTHTIRAGEDEVSFYIEARNPTAKRSEAHWAQPCIRLGPFTGFSPETKGDLDDYLPKCFIFLDGKLARMPTAHWAKQARYIPGQVWGAPGVPREDLNPRPISKNTPSNGLIGCFSADEKMIFAVAFDPYQELFQGIARCLHSDFRLGGVPPGETKIIRGKIYIVANDVPALLKRYKKDFPDQAR